LDVCNGPISLAQTAITSALYEEIFGLNVTSLSYKKFFDHLTGTDGLYEIRIELGTNIYRIFCCFDEGNIIVLFNGFQKKTRKTPPGEIEKAAIIKKEYFDEKLKIKAHENNKKNR
jgi:putative component of toxin-antitoxin plasmid stabilization module